MSGRSPAARPRVDRLALLGLGVDVVGVGLGLQPVHVPRVLPAGMLAIGTALIAMAGLLGVRRRRSSVPSDGRDGRRRDVERVRAIAGDCTRMRDAIDTLLAGAGGHRRAQRERAAVERYRAELRPLVLGTLDDVDGVCAVSGLTRSLAQGQSFGHLRLLRDAFNDFEQQLSRSVADAA